MVITMITTGSGDVGDASEVISLSCVLCFSWRGSTFHSYSVAICISLDWSEARIWRRERLRCQDRSAGRSNESRCAWNGLKRDLKVSSHTVHLTISFIFLYVWIHASTSAISRSTLPCLVFRASFLLSAARPIDKPFIFSLTFESSNSARRDLASVIHPIASPVLPLLSPASTPSHLEASADERRPSFRRYLASSGITSASAASVSVVDAECRENSLRFPGP